MSDLAQLPPLLSQLGYPKTVDELEKQYEIFISQKDYGVAVAERENKIIGLVAWSKSIAFVLPAGGSAPILVKRYQISELTKSYSILAIIFCIFN